MLASLCSKSFKLGFSSTWTQNFQMYKLDLETAEEPEIKSPTSAGSQKKQENSKNNLLMLHWLCESFWLCSVQSLSRVWLFATPWAAARQAALSITNSRSLLKLMSIASVMPSSHLILCHTLLHLPSIFPSIRVFSKESVLRIRWPKYWSFQLQH